MRESKKNNMTVLMSLPSKEVVCPKCNVAMENTTLMGINVEKCPICMGTFFDNGEVTLLVRRHLRAHQLTRRFLRWLYTSKKTN